MKLEKKKNLVTFLKVVDPIAWRKPNVVFLDEDLEDLSRISVHRVAGVIICETDETIMIGEVETAEDNPELTEFGYTYPKYRYVMTLLKSNIVERQDFKIKE